MEKLLRRLEADGITADEKQIRQAIQKIGADLYKVENNEDVYENLKNILKVNAIESVQPAQSSKNLIDRLYQQTVLAKQKSEEQAEKSKAALQNADNKISEKFQNAVDERSELALQMALLFPQAITSATAQKIEENRETINQNYADMEREILKMILGE